MWGLRMPLQWHAWPNPESGAMSRKTVRVGYFGVPAGRNATGKFKHSRLQTSV